MVFDCPEDLLIDLLACIVRRQLCRVMPHPVQTVAVAQQILNLVVQHLRIGVLLEQNTAAALLFEGW